MKRRTIALALALGFGLIAASSPSPAQKAAPAAGGDSFYKPPGIGGVPGRRVAGAARGTQPTSLPTLDLIAPDDRIAGETMQAAPDLYYFVSGPTSLPMRLTIAAPMQPAPVLALDLPAPAAAGIYRVSLAGRGVDLAPGVRYTWSVAITVNRDMPSDDIVASASLVRVAGDPAFDAEARRTAPAERARLYAQAGLWYNAVAAADAAKELDRHAALDRLLDDANLPAAAQFDHQTAANGH
jgi:hypothetical protein